VVWKLDRRSPLSHLLAIVTSLKDKRVAFRSLTENLDTTTPSGEFLFQVFGALAQYERALIQGASSPAGRRPQTRPDRRPAAGDHRREAGRHRRRARWRHVQGGGVPQFQRQAHHADRNVGEWVGVVGRTVMSNKNKLLTVLSDAEQEALYGLPDFDDAQRLEYLALTETELALASSRPGLRPSLLRLADRLLQGQARSSASIERGRGRLRLRAEPLFPRRAIRAQGDHQARALHPARADCPVRLPAGAADFLPHLAAGRADRAARRDTGVRGRRADRLAQRAQDHPARLYHPARAGQRSPVRRTSALGRLAGGSVGRIGQAALGQLLVRDDTLSQLAALKQDAKDFGWRQMAREREKRATLEPLHGSPRRCCPSSASRSRTCCTTRAWRTSTPSTICAT
jgi:hypothetical protein